MAGPAFNAGRYGLACAAVCAGARRTLGVPALTAMFAENPGREMLGASVVAAIAGFAAAFAMTKSTLNEMLPGVAIAVALVPPLAVAGIGLAHFDWTIFANAFLLFLTNVIGIVLFAVVVFLVGLVSERIAALRFDGSRS